MSSGSAHNLEHSSRNFSKTGMFTAQQLHNKQQCTLYSQQSFGNILQAAPLKTMFFHSLSYKGTRPNTTKCSWHTEVSKELHIAIYSDTESFKFLQVVVERLDIRKDAHGVWLVPHLQHVVHLDETEAVSVLPGRWNGAMETLRSVCQSRGRSPSICWSYSAVVKARPRLCLRLDGSSVL